MSRAADLIEAARHLATRGLSPGSSGNVSARDGDRILITPTGSSLSRVTEADLAELSLGDEPPRGRPSKEWPLHLAVYRTRPGSGAVVHLHSPHATALSCLEPDNEFPLETLTPYHAMRLRSVPLLPYAPPGSDDLAAGVARAAADTAAMLLGNHGTVVAGADIASAIDLSEELEAAAQIQLLVAGRRVRPLPPGEADRLHVAHTIR
ncbi:class II aldolase/adducin family protein [Herbiconiux sp. L3-i23]|uniref:class II aldolase/adducin family protein n=1 Tax=Herbiconiux sp. L3-i23 TaxID=2905871 RepID=UPI002052B4A1|nr:class II aldolase/adducin family protein [Herbiconiux sp. L3-i23]BDI21466.1 aldolase [Herbiconiux sp. L3-i23]